MLLASNGYHSIVRCTNGRIVKFISTLPRRRLRRQGHSHLSKLQLFSPLMMDLILCAPDYRHLTDTLKILMLTTLFSVFNHSSHKIKKTGWASPRRGKPNNSTTHGATQKAKGRAKE